MLIPAIIVVALILAIVVAIIATRPSSFRVSRKALMPASAPATFEQVNDLHNWEAWSPFAKLDPQAKTDYKGPRAGYGASYGWDGNKKVGAGRMTITESLPHRLIKIRLDMTSPFALTHYVEFTFTPDGDQTMVTWSVSGENNFMGKAMGMFMDCDKMIGGQFQTGLEQMKAVLIATTPRLSSAQAN